MRIIVGDIWECDADYIGIPTNGSVKKSGAAVMGAGVAKQAVVKYPGVQHELGIAILSGGNRIHLLKLNLFSFPVKHNWWEKADLDLITQSLHGLKGLSLMIEDRTFAIPYPGIGNGKRTMSEVAPVLIRGELPNNVILVVYPKDVAKCEHEFVGPSAYPGAESRCLSCLTIQRRPGQRSTNK